MNYYTGIGSRKTPGNIIGTMRAIARDLDQAGFTLRSGHADGADKAFESGCSAYHKEIYLPWPNFNYARPNQLGHIVMDDLPMDIQHEAQRLAAEYHPNWAACNSDARKLHTRNIPQVLGQDLNTPSKFIVCWTPNGSGSGGTGQALRIAKSYNIPIFDLGSPDGLDRLIQFGNSL